MFWARHLQFEFTTSEGFLPRWGWWCSTDIESGEDAEESNKMDEEDELSVDQIWASRKINSFATIKALRLKPSLFSRMAVPLCRMVPMPIVRPTLSSNLASLKDNFVHAYQEGADVFYLSTTNEGGQVDKVMDEDLAN
jgi:hypothetical protein